MDDNNNGIEDFKEAPVVGETSLRSLKMEWVMNGVAVFLRKADTGDKIKIWKDKEKKQELNSTVTITNFSSRPRNSLWRA